MPEEVQYVSVLRKSAQSTPLARWRNSNFHMEKSSTFLGSTQICSIYAPGTLEPALSAQDSWTRCTVPYFHQEGTPLCETIDLMKYRYLECVLRTFERRERCRLPSVHFYLTTQSTAKPTNISSPAITLNQEYGLSQNLALG